LKLEALMLLQFQIHLLLDSRKLFCFWKRLFENMIQFVFLKNPTYIFKNFNLFFVKN
jgi:hypothetical protein